ncbi:helix-turn-helix domain-containing protein [Komagataeibacter europaeus]|uniref:helix-turn-helix domain-containing protein n=1 Tax=Komagataeibacter europaeus TaxID=33995 RepID=UPI0015F946BC|nr:helix-turn-helix transcriptional regulator [Komagataeibacter europaeus]
MPMLTLSPPTDQLPSWLAQAGTVAAEIGTPDFYCRLLSLLETLIPHHSSWIISYSTEMHPDVIYTNGVSMVVTQWYVDAYRNFDPFWRMWQHRRMAGVITLERLDTAIKADIYTDLFQREAGFRDELGVILPSQGNHSLILFLQRNDGVFTQSDINRVQTVFPIMQGLHQAHVNFLFNMIDGSGMADSRRAVMIRDRSGACCYKTAGWDVFARTFPDRVGQIMDYSRTCQTGEAAQRIEFETGMTVQIKNLGECYPLAPGATLYTVECMDRARVKAADITRLGLTNRESEILSLILADKSSGEIAQKLRVSKGTVKNHRARLYRKIGVTSERALIAYFARAG